MLLRVKYKNVKYTKSHKESNTKERLQEICPHANTPKNLAEGLGFIAMSCLSPAEDLESMTMTSMHPTASLELITMSQESLSHRSVLTSPKVSHGS